MTTYAYIVDGIVSNVIVADQEFIDTMSDASFYKQLTRGGIGWSFDGTTFIEPQPYPSWTLDSNKDWQPPTPRPNVNSVWNETTLSWVST